MAKLVALYRMPKNTEAFDRYYYGTHVPIARLVPGLKKYDVSNGPVGSPTGASDYHLVATLYFDSIADIHAGLASAEGQAAAADLANFADGGVELLMFDTHDV